MTVTLQDIVRAFGTPAAQAAVGGAAPKNDASVLTKFITPGKEKEAEAIANNAGYTLSKSNTGGAGATPSTVTTPPATIVTSTQSQNTYANNQNTINTALTNLKQTPANDPSVVNMLNLNKMPSDVVSRANMAVQMGLVASPGEYIASANAGTNADINTQMLNNLRANNTGNNNNNTKTDTVTPPTPTPPTPTPPVTPPVDPNSVLDPAMAKMYNDAISNANDVVTARYNDVQSALATVQNDPAAVQALQAIRDSYAPLIDAMNKKNAQLMGRTNNAAAAYGGLGQMTQDFMSAEMNNANQRMTELIAKENDSLLKTSIAYKDADIKAYNAATTAYEKANKDKLTAINDLAKATNDAVKATQAQQKADLAEQKQTFTEMNTYAKTNAPGLVAATKGMNAKDTQTVVDSFINSYAQMNGLTDTEKANFTGMINGELATAGQTAAKTDASLANTDSIIANRGKTTTQKGGTDGSYNYTSADVATYTNLLNQGGTSPDGTVIAARGSDGYVDPGAYTAALNDWVKHGGTPTGFAKKFPVKGNVNPVSYKSLPKAIQPVAVKTP